MFLGHFAVGLALKRVAPESNLGWLIAAPLFLDLIWPIFVLAGLERVEIDPGNTVVTPLNFVYYPISHSLMMALVWSLVVGVLYYAISRYGKGAVAVCAGVFSHWLLDVVVHRADLPLYPGSNTVVGLGLWNSFAGTLVAEIVLFVAGAVLYLTFTRAVDKVGRYAMWAFLIFVALIYAANVLGPPPRNSTAVAATVLLMWIFPIWAGWADNHRVNEP